MLLRNKNIILRMLRSSETISELGVAQISQSLGTSRDKTGLVFFKVIIVFLENYAN